MEPIPDIALTPREERLELACLQLRARVYGIDLSQMREIVRCQEVTPLPKAPTLIEGVIDLRGAAVPVVDLGLALDGVASQTAPSDKIAVLEIRGLVLGLRVEAALDVLSVSAAALEAPPALAVHAGYDAVRAVLWRPDEAPILVLSLDHLLDSIQRSGLPGGPEGL